MLGGLSGKLTCGMFTSITESPYDLYFTAAAAGGHRATEKCHHLREDFYIIINRYVQRE